MTIKRPGPVGLWALGDPFGSTVYGSQQAAISVRPPDISATRPLAARTVGEFKNEKKNIRTRNAHGRECAIRFPPPLYDRKTAVV